MKNIYITESQLKHALMLMKEDEGETNVMFDENQWKKANPAEKEKLLAAYKKIDAIPGTGVSMEVDAKKMTTSNIDSLAQTNESVVFTKKQIKEAKRSKRIAESKVFTKADIVKNL